MAFYFYYIIFSLILIFLSRRFNFLIHKKNLPHKSLTSHSKVSILGGILFLIFLLFKFNLNNYFWFVPFFLLGLLSDINYFSNPKKRIFIQIILIILFVFFLKIKIFKTNFFILDFALNNNLFNFLFILMILYLLNLFNVLYLGDSGSYILALFSGYLLIDLANNNPYLSPFYIVLLLWYPCFENLFSIFRRKNKFDSSLNADNKHLHHLIYIFIKNIFNTKNIWANIISAFIINFYNFSSIMFSIKFIYKTKFIILLIIINITVYFFIYHYLNRKIKNLALKDF